jgi:hypothetical protein
MGVWAFSALKLVEFGVAECLDRQCIRSITFFFMDATNGRVVEELTMDCDQFHGEYPSTTPSEALRQLTRKHRLLVQTVGTIFINYLAHAIAHLVLTACERLTVEASSRKDDVRSSFDAHWV